LTEINGQTDGQTLVALEYGDGCNHVFKIGGQVPWSRVLLPFYRKTN